MMNARDEGQVGKAQVVLIGFSGRAGQGGSAPSKGPRNQIIDDDDCTPKLPLAVQAASPPAPSALGAPSKSLFIPIRSMGMLVGA